MVRSSSASAPQRFVFASMLLFSSALTSSLAFSVVSGSSTSLLRSRTLSSTDSKTVLSTGATVEGDTPVLLPDFGSRPEYLDYMESVAALPQGFATGTANGQFTSVEAPGLGPLPIRGTVIHLTNGPTESWAAVFTKNKVRSFLVCGGCRLSLSFMLIMSSNLFSQHVTLAFVLIFSVPRCARARW